jgi:hypothetical protein
MPIKDTLLIFAEELDIHATAGNSTVGTSVINVEAIVDYTGTAGYDNPGIAGGMFWNVEVGATALLAAVDGSVITFALYADTDSTPTTGGDVIDSFTVTANTPAEATQAAGKILASRPLPILPDGMKPYIGILVSVATQNLSAGTINSWIGPPITNAHL